MPTVHLFACTGRFKSFEEMREFIDPQYVEDEYGEVDSIPSPFMQEVDLTSYEPMCIEAIHSDETRPLPELLEGVSYGDQWVPQVPQSEVADAAICVYDPNIVGRPSGCSLDRKSTRLNSSHSQI